MIEIKNVTRAFGDIRALDGVDCSVEKGTILGLVGKNGAGKTTLLRILAAMLTPSSGTVTVDNKNIHTDGQQYKYMTGFCSSHSGGLYMTMSVMDNINFFASMYRLPKAVTKKRSNELLKYFDLYSKKNEFISSLSTGMYIKLKIAIAVIHSPRILILDEATSGLDYESVQKTIALVKFLKEECGSTVFFTTHKINEIDLVATELAVLDSGRILSQGRISQYYNDYKNIVCIKAVVNQNDKSIIEQYLEANPALSMYTLEPAKEHDSLILKIYTNINDLNANEVINYLIPGLKIRGLWTEDLNLDAMVKIITEKSSACDK